MSPVEAGRENGCRGARRTCKEYAAAAPCQPAALTNKPMTGVLRSRGPAARGCPAPKWGNASTPAMNHSLQLSPAGMWLGLLWYAKRRLQKLQMVLSPAQPWDLMSMPCYGSGVDAMHFLVVDRNSFGNAQQRAGGKPTCLLGCAGAEVECVEESKILRGMQLESSGGLRLGGNADRCVGVLRQSCLQLAHKCVSPSLIPPPSHVPPAYLLSPRGSPTSTPALCVIGMPANAPLSECRGCRRALLLQ